MGSDCIQPRTTTSGCGFGAALGREKKSGELFNVDGVCGDEVPSDDMGLEGSSSGQELR